MNLDDIVYMSILIFSIVFGKYYRTITDLNTKQFTGTIVGILIVFIVSGYHIIHPLITFLINAIIIRNTDPKICHKVSFAFSFLYLFFFRTTQYFGIPYPPAHTNLIQMILTLKIVGLAFEVNRSNAPINEPSTSKKNDDDERQYSRIDPSTSDMFHYCFNYIGVLTGPYYRYSTFKDSLNKPFAQYADNWAFTLNKLKFVPLFIVLFLWSSAVWPLSYAVTDEFYNERSWLYRYWYIWPNFFTFRMRMYIGLVLSECVCTMGGLGVYPDICKPKPGEGPTEKFGYIEEISGNQEQLAVEQYNYDTIKNVNPYGADFCVTYREGMKHWNICIQYWLAVNIYKNWPSKKFRTHVTLLVSAVWHGVYTGYYCCIATVPFVLLVEDVWVKLLLKDEAEEKSEFQRKAHRVAVWFFKMHFFSYQAIAMHLLELGKIFHYYNSIFHVGLLLGIALYFIGMHFYKIQRKNKNKIDQNVTIDQNGSQQTKSHTN